MASDDEIQAAAEWMVLELEAAGELGRAQAASHLHAHFGDGVVHEGEGGGTSIDAKVTDAFDRLVREKTGRPAVYEGETWFLRLRDNPLI